MKKVLVIGYGSIGKRHVNNLILLGFEPYVLTSFPEERENVKFIKSLDECIDAQYAIIATPTYQHLNDFISLVRNTNCKEVLIEKPIEASLEKAFEIKKIAEESKIDVFIGYNMRFLEVFKLIKKYITEYINSIRIIKILGGQYLPGWRSHKDYKKSYSAFRELGGGVDLDLSHEIDYMLWLFGIPTFTLFIITDKISDLEIESPDYFKGIYKYHDFIIDVELDYIRKKERKMKIIGENKYILNVDFIEKSFKVMDKDLSNPALFDFEGCYIKEIKAFLGLTPVKKLANLDDGINVLKLLKKD